MRVSITLSRFNASLDIICVRVINYKILYNKV